MVAALALLIVGGMALVNAVSGEPDKSVPPSGVPGPSGGASPSATPSSPPAAAAASAGVPLVIRVTGPATTVYVKVSTNGDVLTHGVLATGETRKYEESPLSVVATNGGSLEVLIYGKRQPPVAAGTRGQWYVKAQNQQR